MIPSIDFLHYFSKSSAISYCISVIIKKSSLLERKLVEYLLNKKMITSVRFYVDINRYFNTEQ